MPIEINVTVMVDLHDTADDIPDGVARVGDGPYLTVQGVAVNGRDVTNRATIITGENPAPNMQSTCWTIAVAGKGGSESGLYLMLSDLPG